MIPILTAPRAADSRPARPAALTCGELWESVGSWTLSYRYAREQQQSRDLSAFSLGRSAQEIVGPLLITGVVLAQGPIGWICLAGAFAAVVLPLHAVVTALEQTHSAGLHQRPRPAITT